MGPWERIALVGPFRCQCTVTVVLLPDEGKQTMLSGFGAEAPARQTLERLNILPGGRFLEQEVKMFLAGGSVVS